ncbi:biotin/lipoyl-containing protein [[Clostridium] dakarense]|uniref:biotin/lipoyl-containing protein n=1 Tax=Faecalimicrobium dakarense TaxID=1301100 RepID=UPI0004B4BC8C|nr:biotin/lipoyl-containing protein [[Clostridium] dakarense]
MNAKTYHIKLNGKVYEVEIEEVESKDTNREVVKETKTNSNPIENKDGEMINAPMPGTILNLLVKEGENIKKGQVVAILEAMKMENEIVSSVDGKVKCISVSKGQNVNLGDNLLQIV